MRTMIKFALVASVILAGMVASAAPEETKAGAMPAKGSAMGCPVCATMKGAGMEMGKEIGKDASPAVKLQCQMIMNTELTKDDVACILAVKDDLKLTPEQVKQLAEISSETREITPNTLEPNQTKMLEGFSVASMSMCAMLKQTCETKAPKTESAGKAAPAMSLQGKMMMNAEISKNDPQCLQAIKGDLKLIPERVQQLEMLTSDSRAKAVAILTPEQKSLLAEIPAAPMSLGSMHKKCMKK